jgi:hypothetical protein
MKMNRNRLLTAASVPRDRTDSRRRAGGWAVAAGWFEWRYQGVWFKSIHHPWSSMEKEIAYLL